MRGRRQSQPAEAAAGGGEQVPALLLPEWQLEEVWG